MRDSSRLDVKVVYSATGRKGGQWARLSPGPPSRTRLVLLGVLNLLVAAGLYYGAWWRVDRDYLYIKLLMTTPLVGLDAEATTGFLVPPAPNKTRSPQVAPSRRSANGEAEAARLMPTTCQTLIPGAAYSWLTLATAAACALALAAGASFGRVAGPAARRAGLLLALAAMIGLLWGGYEVWSEYGRRYPPNHLRIGMGALVLFFGLCGLALGRGVRGWTVVAALTLLLSAVGTVVGLYVGKLCDAVHPAGWPVPFLVGLLLVFVAHSLWAWILFPVAARTGR